MKKILNLIIPLSIISTASCQESRKVKVTVIEESGVPVEGAQVSVWYMGYKPEDSKEDKGTTNKLGVFIAQGTPLLRMEAHISKDGYYSSRSGRLSRKKDHDVTYVLRRVKKPIPLYARRVALIIPVLGQECGYDFKVGDWVAPHGKGRKSMCIFRMDAHVSSSEEYKQSLGISFPNNGDGLSTVNTKKTWKESEFKWLYKAPENGYIAESIFEQVREPNNSLKFDPGQQTYVLRVNTQLDKNGNLVSSNYVRISKGVQLFGVLSDKSGFTMTCYYNPTPNDRNLEFDLKRNLFKGLDSTERVNEP